MNIQKLREPKLHIGEIDIAIFDVLATIGGGYLLAEKMKWSKTKTIPAMFVAGYFAYNITGTTTPLNTYINQTFAPRPVDGITTADLPINNSTTPVGVNEVRFSTF